MRPTIGELDDEKIIELYKGHGTCEQYHSELKTDMDLERLPSGKFATNQLIMACGALVYVFYIGKKLY